MKKFQKTITVYDLGEGFFAEVSKQGKLTEFYLYHEDYGIKEVIFGIEGLKESEWDEHIPDVVHYIENYREEYMEA